ncbi:contractile injection system tape measure protein [Enterobacter sp. ECC-175]|uniref:contractile injection system tape measure protein n=1 Tax=unclassified Enterobacter TaxID=2608935 RepID=UPI000D3F3A1F|nr:contractile injection system tape measure protein [Enterobacter sp. RIT 418]
MQRIHVVIRTPYSLAENIQQQVSQIMNNSLPDKMRLCFQHHFPMQSENDTHFIDRLHLDLGTLDARAFHEQFIQRVLEELDKALSDVELMPLSAEGESDRPYISPDEAFFSSDRRWLLPSKQRKATEIENNSSSVFLSPKCQSTLLSGNVEGEIEYQDITGQIKIPFSSACPKNNDFQIRPFQMKKHDWKSNGSQHNNDENTRSQRSSKINFSKNVLKSQNEKKLTQYLLSGYWPAVNSPQGEDEHWKLNSHSGGEATAGNTPARLLASLLSSNKRTELLWLMNILKLSSRARERLLNSFPAEVFEQWYGTMTASQHLVVPPAEIPFSPSGVMLAHWHYHLHHPELLLTHSSGIPSSPELVALTRPELQWLNALLVASAEMTNVASGWRLWLVHGLQCHGEEWASALTQKARDVLQRLTGIACREKGDAGSIQYNPELEKPDSSTSTLQSALSPLQEESPPAPSLSRQRLQDRSGAFHDDKAQPESMRVHNAGLVLLWPLLPRLFREAGLAAKADEESPLLFVSTQAQQAAISLLDTLAWRDDEGGEWRAMASKLICSWPLTLPLNAWGAPEQAHQTQSEILLQSVIYQIPGLRRCTPEDIRMLFLQRPGTLTALPQGWQLSVDNHPGDTLLKQLPWPLREVHYPWLAEPFAIDWDIERFYSPSSPIGEPNV